MGWAVGFVSASRMVSHAQNDKTCRSWLRPAFMARSCAGGLPQAKRPLLLLLLHLRRQLPLQPGEAVRLLLLLLAERLPVGLVLVRAVLQDEGDAVALSHRNGLLESVLADAARAPHLIAEGGRDHGDLIADLDLALALQACSLGVGDDLVNVHR